MMQATWYFDFISPFSYLQLVEFARLPDDLEITCTPVLFAGLLGYWRHKGPAEIPSKRIHTYRYCQWYAERRGVPFVMPPQHPFNPLRTLRLALVLECSPQAIGDIFRFIFARGGDVESAEGWSALVQSLGLDDADARVADPAIKARLRHNTDTAVQRGVFGVPTFALGDELFWGVDSTDMFIDYVRDPARFAEGEMARLRALPIGKQRPM